MLRFEGDRDFALAPEALLAKLTDARFLVQVIPDVDSVPDLQPDRATLVLRPGFAFVRGTLDVTMHIIPDAKTMSSARVLLESRGIGSSSEVEATLTLSPQQESGGGSRVHWTAEVKSLGGLLKLVPGGLIRGAAEKVINDAWNRIGEKLATPAS